MISIRVSDGQIHQIIADSTALPTENNLWLINPEDDKRHVFVKGVDIKGEIMWFEMATAVTRKFNSLMPDYTWSPRHFDELPNVIKMADLAGLLNVLKEPSSGS